MSRLPENYERLIPFSDGTSSTKYSLISFHQREIERKLQGIELAPAYQSMMNTIQALVNPRKMDDDSLDYMLQLLMRLDRHVDYSLALKVPGEDKTANDEQLHLLLNQKLAYIDRDIMNGMLYIAGIVALVAIALLTVAATATFLIANPAMSFMIVLPIFALTAMGVMIQNPDHLEYKLEAIGGALFYSGYMLYLAPGLFLATAGAYLAAFATLAGVYLATQHCVNEIAFSANNYSLRSDVSTLMTTGLFANNLSEQVDLNNADVESDISSVVSTEMMM